MKKLGLLLVACALFASAGKSYADDFSADSDVGVYVGGGLNWGLSNSNTFKSDAPDSKKMNLANVGPAINVVVGYNIMPVLAVEAEYNWGIGRNLNTKNTKGKFSSHSFLANVVGKLEVAEGSILFAKAGIGYGLFTDVANNTTINTSGFTFQVGAGYEFAFDANNSVLIGYNFKMTPNLSVTGKGQAVKDEFASATKSLSTHSLQVAYKFTF